MNYQFDDIAIEVGQRQVTRDGEKLDIGGLTFDLLLAIVEAAPNIVSADELAEKVWSGRPVTPETLTQRTMMLRQALGDDADHPKYVEVIRGQGLKLIPELASAKSKRVVALPKIPKSLVASIAGLAVIIATVMITKTIVGSQEPTYIEPSTQVRRSEMHLGELSRVGINEGGVLTEIALSPDGSHLVYVASTSENTAGSLYLRALNNLDAEMISGTESARHPFFSPDGEWIGFDTDLGTKIQKVSVRGGLKKTLAEGMSRMYGASWSEDGTIVYSTTNGQPFNQTGKLVKIPANGGTPEDILVSNDFYAYTWPHFLPDGQSLLFAMRDRREPSSDGDIGLLSLDSGEYRTLIAGAYHPKYSPTGHIVFARKDTLWAVPFDAKSGEITGEESPLFDGVEHQSNLGNFVYDFSNDGLLVYLQGIDVYANQGASRVPVWVDRQGDEEPINLPPADYWGPQISPDGKQAVVMINHGENPDIYTVDLERETSTRRTFGAGFDGLAVWSPDGDRFFYSSEDADNKNSIYSRAANGTGQPELISANDIAVRVTAISPDGERMIVNGGGRGTSDMYILSLTGESFPQPFVTSEFDETSAAISPDGNYVAYVSDGTGQDEVYVRTFPDPDGGLWQISRDGAQSPRWSPEGGELFFRGVAGNTYNLHVVDIKTEPTFSFDNLRLLLAGNYSGGPSAYAVAKNGERFLMFKDPAQLQQSLQGTPAASTLTIVENWFEELRQIAPSDTAN